MEPRRTFKCQCCQSQLVLPLTPEAFDKVARERGGSPSSCWAVAWVATEELADATGWVYWAEAGTWSCPTCTLKGPRDHEQVP